MIKCIKFNYCTYLINAQAYHCLDSRSFYVSLFSFLKVAVVAAVVVVCL